MTRNELEELTRKIGRLDNGQRQFVNGLVTGLEIKESSQKETLQKEGAQDEQSDQSPDNK